MNDLVLDGFVKGFAASRGLSGLPEDDQFEAFATSTILRRYHQADITDIEEDVLVGGGGDGGLDAITILVNGRPTRSQEDVEFFVDRLGRLDVEFVFLQAKTTAAFNAGQIGTSIFGVRQFFEAVSNSNPDIVFKEEILQLIDLARYLYGQISKMQSDPKCYFYFVTTGQWTDAPEPRARMADGKSQLEQLNIFSSVRLTPIDSDVLKTDRRLLDRSVVKTIEFGKNAAFPAIAGVHEAYIGLLPGDEFIELVSTDEGDLNRELFYDNVRDFQGHNSVNREISSTISDHQHRNTFPLLNNGITIIAGDMRRTGDVFQIQDFQIVNGCQTAHILFQHKEFVGPDIFIPIKIVATQDSQVVNEVIKATNRQTEVLPEALESLTSFHKELEDFYLTRETTRASAERIYYERRSKQYLLDNVHPTNVVTLARQIQSFIGMFLDDPHSHPRYYGELLKAYEGRIFALHHRPEPYYASGVALLAVEKWFNKVSFSRELRPYKYHLLMLLRMIIGGVNQPQLNSNRMADYALKVVDTIREPFSGPQQMAYATDLLKRSLDEFNAERGPRSYAGQGNPPHRLRAFTERLISDWRNGPQGEEAVVSSDHPSVGSSGTGRIKFFDDIKRYGFIETADGGDVFVHESGILEVPYHLRVRDREVVFTIVDDPRLPGKVKAEDVRLAN